MNIKLENVQKTLLIPLWSRAEFSKENNSILVDLKAIDIVKKLDFDFEPIDKKIPFFTSLMFLARASMLDETIKNYISTHPKATIINLGAGLDTTFFRIDNGLINWFDIDLIDVMEIRQKVLPDTERSHNIAGSIFELKWVKEITQNQNGVLFISGGVLPYFQEKVIKKFLFDLANNFPESEFVFDTLSKTGVFISNCGTKFRGVKSASFYWGMKDAEKMKKWDRRIEIIEQYPLFSRIKREEHWSHAVKKIVNYSDKHRLANIIHLKFLK